ncbi:MAG: hypothetical protein R3E83_11650 [Burkholderiaceae bacterium]
MAVAVISPTPGITHQILAGRGLTRQPAQVVLQSVDPILELFDLEHQPNQGGPDQRTDRALRVAQHASDARARDVHPYRNIDPELAADPAAR